MKKLLTTLLLTLLCVLCVFAFTACGGSDNKDKGQDTEQSGTENGDDTEKEPETEVKTTVTEEEWKTALSYFKAYGEEGESDFPRINFGCNVKSYLNGDGAGTDDYMLSLDFNKKASEYKIGTRVYYSWKDGDNCYMTVDEQGTDSETGELIVGGYSKKILSEEELLEGFNAYIYVSAGGMYISVFDLVGKFSEFTYSEEKEAYTANFGDEEGSCAISVKFKDGKLALFELVVTDEEAGIVTTIYEYTYGITVTVPANVVNLEVG